MKKKELLQIMQDADSDLSKRLGVFELRANLHEKLTKQLSTLTERFNIFESSGNKYLSGRLDNQKTQLFELSQLFDGHAKKIADMAKRVDLMNDKFHATIKTVIKDSADQMRRIDQLIRVFDQMDIRLAKLEQVKQKKVPPKRRSKKQ